MRKKKIYIDPGHGGDSIGASYKGRLEQDDVLKLSLAVGKLLGTQRNIEVKFSRVSSVNPAISVRAKEANDWGADYFISIHRNAFQPEKASGAECWCDSKIAKGGETYNKAKNILDKLCEESGYTNRGVKRGAPAYSDYGVNSLTRMASCLLEAGFIDNSLDNKVFDERFEDIALALAKGLCEAVGEKFVLPGDIDGDGAVTPADARLALRAAVGLEILKDEGLLAADVTFDGQITPADARLILRMATGSEAVV